VCKILGFEVGRLFKRGQRKAGSELAGAGERPGYDHLV
jgi:hypothetical protein